MWMSNQTVHRCTLTGTCISPSQCPTLVSQPNNLTFYYSQGTGTNYNFLETENHDISILAGTTRLQLRGCRHSLQLVNSTKSSSCPLSISTPGPLLPLSRGTTAIGSATFDHSSHLHCPIWCSLWKFKLFLYPCRGHMAFSIGGRALCVGILCFLLAIQTEAAYQFKVGGLDAWGLPTAVKPDIYTQWAAKNKFHVGDSLLFLYPPSQDSVIQVTEEAYHKCNSSNPIASFDDGNTVFKFDRPGSFYFTSGVAGHCEKSQKLAVIVMGKNGALAPTPAFGLLIVEGSPGAGVGKISDAPIVQSVGPLGLMGVLAFGLCMLLL
eukprot:Gb_09364 [translate_table: standard]